MRPLAMFKTAPWGSLAPTHRRAPNSTHRSPVNAPSRPGREGASGQWLQRVPVTAVRRQRQPLSRCPSATLVARKAHGMAGDGPLALRWPLRLPHSLPTHPLIVGPPAEGGVSHAHPLKTGIGIAPKIGTPKRFVNRTMAFAAIHEGAVARRVPGAPGIQINVPAIYPNALPPDVPPSASLGTPSTNDTRPPMDRTACNAG